jgi:hypothetical protein
MDRDLPRFALLLGPAGLIPFAALAAGIATGRPGLAVPLAAYGATILAFLGAVHWGLALAASPGERAATPWRLCLGVVPALLAWVALLLPGSPGLWLLASGILGTAVVEAWGCRRGLVPPGYMRLRWALSAGAATCLGLAGWLI